MEARDCPALYEHGCQVGGGLFTREHVAALLFITTWTLLTITTRSSPTLANCFRKWLSVSIQHMCGSFYLRASISVIPGLPPEKLTLEPAEAEFIKSSSCEELRKNINKERKVKLQATATSYK